MSNYEEIFNSNKHLSEDEVVMALFQAGLGIREAQAEYRRLAIDAGIIKTPNQRKEEFEEYVTENFDLTSEEDVTSAKAIGADMEISAPTVTKYLKDMAEQQGVELALPNKVSSTKWKEIVDAFTADEALNGSKEDVVKKINAVGEYNDLAKASAQYNKLRKEFGWEPPASMVSQLVDWYVDNFGAERDEIIAKASEIGMSDASAQYYVNMFKLAFDMYNRVGAQQAA